MIKGGKGGGNTITGLVYEGIVDIATFLNNQKDYSVQSTEVRYKGEIVAYVFKKHSFYKFLEHEGINWRDYI